MDEEMLERVFRGRWLFPCLWGLAGFLAPLLVVASTGLIGLSLLSLAEWTRESEPALFLLAVASAVIPLYVAWIGLILYLVVRRKRGRSKPARNRWEE